MDVKPAACKWSRASYEECWAYVDDKYAGTSELTNWKGCFAIVDGYMTAIMKQVALYVMRGICAYDISPHFVRQDGFGHVGAPVILGSRAGYGYYEGSVLKSLSTSLMGMVDSTMLLAAAVALEEATHEELVSAVSIGGLVLTLGEGRMLGEKWRNFGTAHQQ